MALDDSWTVRELGSVVPLVLFFFQAEDGIRDGHVTGVQTCALPIFSAETAETTNTSVKTWSRVVRARESNRSAGVATKKTSRSEERRVGKEGSTRGGRGQGEQKKTEPARRRGVSDRHTDWSSAEMRG